MTMLHANSQHYWCLHVSSTGVVIFVAPSLHGYMYMYMYMCRADLGPFIVVVRLGLSGLTDAGLPVQPSQSALEKLFTYERTVKIAQAITHVVI